MNNKIGFFIKIKILLTNMIVELLILSIAALFFSEILSALYGFELLNFLTENKDWKLIGITTVAFLIWLISNIHNGLKNFDFSSHLTDIQYNREYPEKVTHFFINETKNYLDIVKIKLDILKSLSPIPIIVLFLGKLFPKNESFSLDIYAYISFSIVFLYFAWLIKVYKKFAALQKNLADYKNLLLKIEQPNLFDEKSRIKDPTELNSVYPPRIKKLE